ncbi:hypothetical protein OJO69_25500, partial [Escherichia coli]|nr:hypothetical protein [Escherichia coli]
MPGYPGRAGTSTARFFSDKGCRRAPLFTAPADAARH